MKTDWKPGDKCTSVDFDKTHILVIDRIKDNHACCSCESLSGLRLVTLDRLRPIPATVSEGDSKRPKLPVGEIRFWWVGIDNLWNCNLGGFGKGTDDIQHTIILRDHWLREAFVKLVEEGKLYRSTRQETWCVRTRIDGITNFCDWRTAVLDLRPDLREALGRPCDSQKARGEG